MTGAGRPVGREMDTAPSQFWKDRRKGAARRVPEVTPGASRSRQRQKPAGSRSQEKPKQYKREEILAKTQHNEILKTKDPEERWKQRDSGVAADPTVVRKEASFSGTESKGEEHCCRILRRHPSQHVARERQAPVPCAARMDSVFFCSLNYT